MIEYKIIDNTPNKENTQEEINSLAKQGWRVIGFTIYQVILEKTTEVYVDTGPG